MPDNLLRSIRKIARIMLTLIILGVIANDAINSIKAFTTASDALTAAKNAAVDVAAQQPDNIAGAQAAATVAAEAVGGRLDTYEQTVNNVSGAKHAWITVRVSAPLGRTFLAAPIIGLVQKTPSANWYTQPRLSLRSDTRADVF